MSDLAEKKYSDPTKAEIYKSNRGWIVWCGRCDVFIDSLGRQNWDGRLDDHQDAIQAVDRHAKAFHREDRLARGYGIQP